MTTAPHRWPRRIRAAVLAAAVTLLVAGQAAAVRQVEPPPQLAAALAKWTDEHPGTSALAWRLDADEQVEVLAYKATAPRRPASTMKVVTAAAALLQLSPDYRFETRLYAGPQVVQNGAELVGPLYLKGYGDPTLSSPAYARRYLGGQGGVMGKLVRPLRDAGVRRVRGPLVVDETVFDNLRRVPSWPRRYASECQPLSGLTTNQSYLGEERGKYAKNPALATGVRTRVAMKKIGITLAGKVSSGRAPEQGRLLATSQSPPLRTIVRLMLPDSDNFLAEMLTKNVGAYGRGVGSTAAGTAQAVTLLTGKGLLDPADQLEDGSGLGLNNRLTATSLVKILAAADAEPGWGTALIDGLASGGEGTLKRRFRAPDLRTRVHAKTGYISRTSTLAGVVDSEGGARYAFAIMMNEGSISGARQTQDTLVTLLASGVADTV